MDKHESLNHSEWECKYRNCSPHLDGWLDG
jgi:hypothetical protein